MKQGRARWEMENGVRVRERLNFSNTSFFFSPKSTVPFCVGDCFHDTNILVGSDFEMIYIESFIYI